MLHWWHRLPGRRLRGVRTRCSDDLAWLPFVLAAYTEFTGDTGILDVPIPWLTGPALTEEEQERYFEPETAGYRSSLYEHAVRALDKAHHPRQPLSAPDGIRGLERRLQPSGGRGTGGKRLAGHVPGPDAHQVFSHLPRTAGRGAGQTIRGCGPRDTARRRKAALTATAIYGPIWTTAPHSAREGAGACAIDSLSQSFAVLCGLNASHTGTALDTALRQLEDGENGLLKLFAPPFGQPDKRVGYTSSYPAGVRENGGQYTHAACMAGHRPV